MNYGGGVVLSALTLLTTAATSVLSTIRRPPRHKPSFDFSQVGDNPCESSFHKLIGTALSMAGAHKHPDADPTEGEIIHKPICSLCYSRTTLGFEKFNILTLHIKNAFNTLQDLLSDRVIFPTGFVPGTCCKCGSDKGLVGWQLYSKLPAVLALHLERGMAEDGAAVKIPCRMKVGKRSGRSKIAEQYARYDVRAVIHHEFETDGGNKYTAALRSPGRMGPLSDKWHLVDESGTVRRINRAKAVNPRSSFMILYERI